jgi:cation:H+ antiporter
MIYILYLVLAAGVVFSSNLAAKYVDILDKQTSLSGAFIGGVMLSAVTSLPELFTSISSTVFLHKPGLCLGNIMGSDMFNAFLLAVLILIFYRSYHRSQISGSHTMTALTVLLSFLAILLNQKQILNSELFTISITSLLLLVFYLISLRFLSGENGTPQATEEEVKTPAMSMRQLIIRLILSSAAIVIISILLTYATDRIAVRLHLEQGFAGALLLGIATSLPELSSTFTLFRIKNHDIAVGNIVGSNIFNFIILTLCDILYFGHGLYDFTDGSTRMLVLMGTIQSAFMLIFLRWKNKVSQVAALIGIIACYFIFLAF